MKVAVIGSGNVGMAVFNELRNTNGVHEAVLIDMDQEKVQAEVTDYLDARALYYEETAKLSYGDNSACEGADIIVYTAGAKRAPGMSRLDLQAENVAIARSVFTEINQYNQDAIVLVIANPVDVLTYEITKMRGGDPSRVIGTGTLLDTARLKRTLSELCEVSVKSIDGYVVGEHGDSSFIVWSSLRISGNTINEYNEDLWGESIAMKEDAMESLVQKLGARMIKGKGYTAYGVGLAACRIISAIVHDAREILPVSTTILEAYGAPDCAISVPCMIGKNGVERVLRMRLTESEKAKLDASIQIVTKNCRE